MLDYDKRVTAYALRMLMDKLENDDAGVEEDFELDEEGVPTCGHVLTLIKEMEEPDRLSFDAEQPLKIKKWLRRGEIAKDTADVRDLYTQAGDLLDRSCSHDIVGECVFEGEDGKFYAGSVEFVVDEATQEYIEELLEELRCWSAN